MNGEYLDTLARTLAPGLTRRSAVARLSGPALGELLALFDLDETDARDRKKKRRRRRRRRERKRRRRDRCIPNSIPFGETSAPCGSASDCCNGSCCSFFDGDRDTTACFDLLSHTTLCGLTCESATNCVNFDPDRECVNGECVEA